MEVRHSGMPDLPDDTNRWGKWLKAMNEICQTNFASIARHVGITRGALSQSIYGNGGVKPETAIAIMKMYRMLAEQQKIPLSVTWDKFFLISWFEDGEIVSQADAALRHIEYVASLVRERNTLLKQVEALKKKNLGRDLLAALDENAQLKGEIERLMGEKGIHYSEGPSE